MANKSISVLSLTFTKHTPAIQLRKLEAVALNTTFAPNYLDRVQDLWVFMELAASKTIVAGIIDFQYLPIRYV